jgi:hypothetical protein
MLGTYKTHNQECAGPNTSNQDRRMNYRILNDFQSQELSLRWKDGWMHGWMDRLKREMISKYKYTIRYGKITSDISRRITEYN